MSKRDLLIWRIQNGIAEVHEYNKNITRGSGCLHNTEKRRPIDDPSIVDMHRHKERKKSVK